METQSKLNPGMHSLFCFLFGFLKIGAGNIASEVSAAVQHEDLSLILNTQVKSQVW